MRSYTPSLLTVWSLWIVFLMALNAGAYLLTPRFAAINIVADRTGFVESKEIRVRFELERPASVPVTIQYQLGGDAERGIDYEIAPGDLVIPAGDSAAILKVHRSGKGVKAERPERSFVIELSKGDGYRNGPSNKLAISFPNTNPPVVKGPDKTLFWTVRLSSTSKMLGPAGSSGGVVVTFELDRNADRRTTVGFHLEGNAKVGRDYVVKGFPDGDEVIFEPGQTRRSLTLERSARNSESGQGDRQIIVSLFSSPTVHAGDPSSLTLLIPDFGARLSWRVEPTTDFDRHSDRKAYLQVALDQSRLDETTLLYRFGGDARANVDYSAPRDPIFLIPAGKREDRQQVFTIKADPLVGGPSRFIDLTIEAVTPTYVTRPSPLRLTLTDNAMLDGKALIILVLTEDLVRNGENVLTKLEALGKDQGVELVGECIYILAGDGLIYRSASIARPLGGRIPFTRETTAESILEAASIAIGRQFGGRIQAADYRTALIWQDLAERRSLTNAQGNDKPSDDGKMHLFWIGPSGPLPKRLGERFPSVGRSQRFHPTFKPDGLAFDAQIDRWLKEH